MLNDLLVIGVVPARQGSKGIPGKNELKLDGKSLTLRALYSGLQADHVDACYLTSDSETLLEEARKHGFPVRERPALLAQDSTTATEVITDCISYIKGDKGIDDFYVLYLQPTSPFRGVSHINSAISELSSSNQSSLIAVRPSKENPYIQFQIETEKLVPVIRETATELNRQSYPKTYLPNGAIYLFKSSEFIRLGGRIPFAGSLPFVMGEDESLDLDDRDDLLKLQSIVGARLSPFSS